MNPLVGNLMVWTGDQTACIRVVGRANFALSVAFRKLLRHLRAGQGGRVLLDLSQCQMMDSTFLGVLAFEATPRSDARGELALCDEIEQTARNWSLAEVLPLVERANQELARVRTALEKIKQG